MLQKVRDNMKGSFVAAVVFLLFIVPLVLTGLGDGSFLGSVAGTDAASVDGKEISKAELRRAVYIRKQNILAQDGVDPNAEFLKDENLTTPVLENLTRRAALVVSAEKGGLGVSTTFLDEQIRERPDFQVDGKFDSQTYQRLLANFAYTPTTYKEALAEDFLVSQQTQGINLSSFSTEDELSKLVSLIQQKRSFYTVKISKELVEGAVEVSEGDIESHYEENKQSFVDPENMSLEYIELSVADISNDIEVSEEEIRETYDQEIADFEVNEEFEIAHLLLEEKENQDAIISEIQGKIKEGAEFEQLVTDYSDDVGSKDAGGNLGVLTKGVFPEPFEQAVYALEQGQVSEPVKTDAGVHFIKVITKTVNAAPTYEARKSSIQSALRLSQAEEIYVSSLERLEELTFSAENLNDAANALGLEVKSTEIFTRNQGQGIASNNNIREAAFSEEVLQNGYNSKRINLSDTQSVVVRKSVHNPERIKSLEEVKEDVVNAVTNKKVSDELDLLFIAVKARIEQGESAETVATEKEYEFKSYDAVERSSSDAGFQVSNKAFSMSLTEAGPSIDSIVDRDGNHILLGLQAILPGQRSDMEDQQYKGLSTQLQLQSASFESASYESQIVSNSDINIY